MSWFFKGRKAQKVKGSSMGLETGSHRSPGLAAICQEIREHQEIRERGEVSLLDLGTSSTENVKFFSALTSNVTVVGLFQACSGQTVGAQRSEVFRFDEAAIEALPKGKAQFDIVIAWDLLHYFDSQELVEFNRSLRRLCRPDALIYLLAANNAPIAKQPLHFRIEAEDSLFYTLPGGESSTTSRLVTRDVEQRMEGFRPMRLFQLRNGFQEFIFRFQGGKTSDTPEDEMSSEVLENRAEKGAVVSAPAKTAKAADGSASGQGGELQGGHTKDPERDDDPAPVPSRGRPPVQRGRRGKRGGRR